MKTTKKTNKPIIVDLTNIESVEDIQFEFIRAKAHAGIKLTDDEIYAVVNYGSTLTLDMIDACLAKYEAETPVVKIHDDELAEKLIKIIEKEIHKKDPWYKRAWKWLTKPFRKNK